MMTKQEQADFEVFLEEYVDTHWDELRERFADWCDEHAERQWEARAEAQA
jgi:hypothetical protein